jgi:hypothetical protein
MQNRNGEGLQLELGRRGRGRGHSSTTGSHSYTYSPPTSHLPTRASNEDPSHGTLVPTTSPGFTSKGQIPASDPSGWASLRGQSSVWGPWTVLGAAPRHPSGNKAQTKPTRPGVHRQPCHARTSRRGDAEKVRVPFIRKIRNTPRFCVLGTQGSSGTGEGRLVEKETPDPSSMQRAKVRSFRPACAGGFG